MPRVAIPKAQHARNAGISLPPDLIRDASRFAHGRGMSLSQWARQIFLKALRSDAKRRAR